MISSNASWEKTDFLISGSRREGSGYAVLKALACGVYPYRIFLRSGGLPTTDDAGAYGGLEMTPLLPRLSLKRRAALRESFERRCSFDAIAREAMTAYQKAWSRRRGEGPPMNARPRVAMILDPGNLVLR